MHKLKLSYTFFYSNLLRTHTQIFIFIYFSNSHVDIKIQLLFLNISNLQVIKNTFIIIYHNHCSILRILSPYYFKYYYIQSN